MDMALNRIGLISSNNIIADKKAVELTLVVNNVKSTSTFVDCEEMCDGDIWEWNLMYGIGNDVY